MPCACLAVAPAVAIAFTAALVVAACASGPALVQGGEPASAHPICDPVGPCDPTARRCGLQSDGCGGMHPCACPDGFTCRSATCVSDAALDDAGIPVEALVCTDALDDECAARCLRESSIACRAALVHEVRRALAKGGAADLCALAVAPSTEAGTGRFMAAWRGVIEARVEDVAARVAVAESLLARDCDGGIAAACREVRRVAVPPGAPFYPWAFHRAVVVDACAGDR